MLKVEEFVQKHIKNYIDIGQFYSATPYASQSSAYQEVFFAIMQIWNNIKRFCKGMGPPRQHTPLAVELAQRILNKLTELVPFRLQSTYNVLDLIRNFSWLSLKQLFQ